MTHDRDISDLLREASAPSTTLTVADLVRHGRRRERHRRWTLAGATAAGVGLALVGVTTLVRLPATTSRPTASSSASPQVSVQPYAVVCPVQQLPVPAGMTEVRLRAADPSGHYATGAGPNAVVWHDGAPTVIPRPGSIPPGAMLPNAVNTQGVVVGGMSDYQDHATAWVWRNGAVTALPTPPGFADGAIATGVNARGDVVGTALAWETSAPLLWPADAPGTVTILDAPQNHYGAQAWAIADDGTIGGDTGDGSHPFLWDPQGVGHVMAELPGTPGGRVLALRGTYAYGRVVQPGDPSRPLAARWDLTTGTLTTFPQLSGSASAGNTHGDLAADFDFFLVDASTAANALIGGEKPHLVALAGNPVGNYSAISMSDDTTLYGHFSPDDGPAVALVWHC